jgi:hypothetical protein
MYQWKELACAGVRVLPFDQRTYTRKPVDVAL